MVAIPLIFGRLTADDYENHIASDPRVDTLRDKMSCVEDVQFTADYHDPHKRAISNGLTIELMDGTILPELVVEYPIGHPRRRAEGIPKLIEKYKTNLARVFSEKQQLTILAATLDYDTFLEQDVSHLMDLFVRQC